jgi:hypothetical protein
VVCAESSFGGRSAGRRTFARSPSLSLPRRASHVWPCVGCVRRSLTDATNCAGWSAWSRSACQASAVSPWAISARSSLRVGCRRVSGRPAGPVRAHALATRSAAGMPSVHRRPDPVVEWDDQRQPRVAEHALEPGGGLLRLPTTGCVGHGAGHRMHSAGRMYLRLSDATLSRTVALLIAARNGGRCKFTSSVIGADRSPSSVGRQAGWARWSPT